MTLGLIAAVAAVADAGVISTVMAEGGRLVNDLGALKGLLRDARGFRRISNALSALAFMPVIIYLLLGTGTGPIALIVALALIVLSSFATATSTIFSAALRLTSRFTAVALVLLGGAAARCLFVLLAALTLGSHVSFVIFLALSALTACGESFAVQRLIGPLPKGTKEPSSYRRAFRRNALRQIPNSVFFVAEGQVLPIVLITVGSPLAFADVSALARFSLGFAVVGNVVGQIFMTRIATTRSPRRLPIVYTQAMGLYGAVAVPGLAVIVLGSVPLLYLLGDQYKGLSTELAIVSLGGFISSLVGLMAGLNQARAWLRLAWVQIPLSTLWICLLLFLVRPADTYSAAWFSALIAIPGILSMALCAWLGIQEDRRREERTDIDPT